MSFASIGRCVRLAAQARPFVSSERAVVLTSVAKLKCEGALGNEGRRLLSNEVRQSGKKKLMSTDDFAHEVAKISVIGRAKSTEL